MKVSRQRAWQLRQKEKGLCIKCNSVAVTSIHCEYHRQESLKYAIARHEKMRENKLCFYCSKPLDREGVYCTICVVKITATSKEKRETNAKRFS